MNRMLPVRFSRITKIKGWSAQNVALEEMVFGLALFTVEFKYSFHASGIADVGSQRWLTRVGSLLFFFLACEWYRPFFNCPATHIVDGFFRIVGSRT